MVGVCVMDWQTITAALIVLGATAYVLRRVWQRLNSFRMAKRDGEASACGRGCSCEAKSSPKTQPKFTTVSGRR